MATSKKKSNSAKRRSRPGGGQKPKSRLKTLEEGLALQQARIETLEAELVKRDKKIRSLEQERDILLRRIYGPMSDRPNDEAQLLLAEIVAELEGREPDSESEGNAEDDDEESPKEERKKRSKPTGRTMWPDHLERVVEEFDFSGEEKIDPETGLTMTFIGWDSRERLVEQPARLYVHVSKRAKYAHRGLNGEPGIITVPEPPEHGNPIDRCKADVSVLAKIIISKYCYHLPLYRLQERYWRLGRVWIPRSTMCGWMTGCAQALEPLYLEMKRRMIESGYVGLDDTTVKMLDPGAGKTASTRMWVYAGLLESAPYLVYEFTQTREGKEPLQFLIDFSGVLLGDAYSGHNQVTSRDDVVRVCCWDHARRYYTDACDEDPAAAAEALAYIKLLYKIEREADEAGVSADERKRLRQERAVPLLEQLKTWLDANKDKHLPKSGMSKAVNYSLNQWESLCVYTTDGNIPISNCRCEQAFKAVATGRKNWLFVGSEGGGRNAALLFSITMTCRHLDLDPYAYLDDILRRINTHPANRIEELLPDHWKREQEAAHRELSLRFDKHRPLREAS